MKRSFQRINFIALFMLVSNCFLVRAQMPLPVNEEGKIFFSEVVKADSIKKDSLFANASRWLDKMQFNEKVVDSVSNKVSSVQELLVYDKGYLFKRLHGKITFSATIEVKDNKYKYTFTDFVYHYYKEDRYHKMVPTGQKKPLEDKKAPGWQALWQEHKTTTLHSITNYVNDLKTAIIMVPEVKKEPAVTAQKKINDNW